MILARDAVAVIGLDRDPALVRDARARAAAAGLDNIQFHEVDVEGDEYERWTPDLITAHLCASDAIIERAGRALRPGSALGMVAFHVDQWRETGRVSRFAYDEARMAAALRRGGLVPEVVEVDAAVTRFSSVEGGLAAAVVPEARGRPD